MYGRVSGRQPTNLPAGLPGPAVVQPEAGKTWLASWKLCRARPICFRLFWHLHPGGGLADLLHGGQQQADQDRR